MGGSNRVPGKASPADPLWYRRGWVLRVSCACRPGKHQDIPVTELLDRWQVSPSRAVWEVVAKLSCRVCKARPNRSELLSAADAKRNTIWW